MTWQIIVMAVGLAAVFEGLVFALAPLRMEELLERLREMPLALRRQIGLAVIAFGVALVWIATRL